MEIETKNASLDTLAVTILALHVSGKQMTLAVFRQLPEGIEQKDSELWGTVRYTIKDAGDLWLVFSDNGRLFRRAINLRSPWVCDKAFRKAAANLESLKNRSKYMNVDNEISAATLLLEKEVDSMNEMQCLYDKFHENEKMLAGLRQLFISV